MTDPTEVEKAKRVMAQCIEDIICRGEVSMLSRAVDMLIAAERRDAKSSGHALGCDCHDNYVDMTWCQEHRTGHPWIDPRCIEWREK